MATAKRDTYGVERIYGVEITRFVREGDFIPEAFEVPAKDVVDDEEETTVTATKTKATKKT
jgi:hypothetical protein